MSPNVTNRSKKSKADTSGIVENSQDKNQKELYLEKKNLKTLSKLLTMIRFFQERHIASSGYELIEIAKALVLETFPVNHRVCEYGDSGEKFYIILKG
jgi:hypothetical protein